MLKFHYSYLLLLFCALRPFDASAQDDYPGQCHRIVVAGAEQWKPFAFNQMEQGQLKARGISYDVIALVAGELGLETVNKVGMPWKRIEIALEQGTVDLLAGNYWSASRAEKWRMTQAFAEEKVVLLARRQAPFTFEGLEDLSGKTGVVPRGISLGKDFDNARQHLQIVEVRTHEQMYHMLNLGRVDYLVSPEYAARQHLALPANQNLIILPKALNTYGVHLSFSPASPCIHLREKFEQVIAKKQADGSISRILSGYYSQ